jgi:3',5'-cyclic AMP phosphodiesterase CpdA
MRLIQISDTHLSPQKSHFVENWAPLVAWIAAERPDLVIHTGDVTIDGAGVEADLAHCASLMRAIDVPFRVVPGNHDVGSSVNPKQPVTRERLAGWERHFGPDRWVHDQEEWRFIGLDALIVGSGSPEEADQLDWLDRVQEEAGGRHLAWFLHKPLFLEHPDEGDTGYWAIPPEPRRGLMERVRRHRVALVASGHLHQSHQLTCEGTHYVWAPSSAFLCGPAIAPPMPGEKHVGAVRYTLTRGAVAAEIVPVPRLDERFIDPIIEEIYPRLPSLKI